MCRDALGFRLHDACFVLTRSEELVHDSAPFRQLVSRRATEPQTNCLGAGVDTMNLFYISSSMDYNTTYLDSTMTAPDAAIYTTLDDDLKPCLLIRLVKRLALISDNLLINLQNQFNEHTATSIASCSVLIIVVSIIGCFILSLSRKEDRKIKEQYKKLNTGSSQSFIGISSGQKIGNNQNHMNSSVVLSSNSHHTCGGISGTKAGLGGLNVTNLPPVIADRFDFHKLHLIELRRETYFGLVRLLKPGCRTIVLLCDAQSRLKLVTKFYQCIYPYRKNKTIQFAFLLIEKNIGWYKDLLKLALSEKRDLHINPINCIGTVLVLNGFKKYFSVYHASDSRCDLDEQLVLLEESLLDNFPRWLEKLFAGKINRYYVKYWPDKMR